MNQAATHAPKPVVIGDQVYPFGLAEPAVQVPLTEVPRLVQWLRAQLQSP